jgi:hypothetical protein
MKPLLKNNVSRYKWETLIGKDAVGRMFQYLTSEYQNKYSFENWLDRVKYKSDPTALLKSRSLLINPKTWYVNSSCTREKLEDREFKNTIRRTLEKMVLHS